MSKKRKILFLGESYRADAITWIKGLKEMGDFEIIPWELQTSNNGLKNRIRRIFEFCGAVSKIRKTVRLHQPDMVIAERTTSYGFLASVCGVQPIAIAQQGRTDLWPEKSLSIPFKKLLQKYAFAKADLIHAWGPVMTVSMEKTKVDMSKVMVLPKGIDLSFFENKNTADDSKINAIVTRSLSPEYRHEVILKAFSILNQKKIDFGLMIIGDGSQLSYLKNLARELKIEDKVRFTGRIHNTELPGYLQKSNFYIGMPITEGVSASLFEAMACLCYPIVTNIAGNRSWIEHRENGQLISVDDSRMLADELIWAFENPQIRESATLKNRAFVEENANYQINMKIIADKYHELINQSKTY